ncbi:MAG: sigma-70 family RNA polymerase sigma factor [Gemmataceae bacterium]|nr:sigma-70 family RNA polymerase sigma factor [Gemmataceae bacterium]
MTEHSGNASGSDHSPNLSDPSDRSLLQRLRRGEDDAATMLYMRYAQRLLALTRSQFSSELAAQVEAEDIVQSVFMSFFRKASQGYYNVPSGEDLWRLLLVITLNKIRAKGNYFRAAKRDVRLNSTGDFPEGDPGMVARNETALNELQIVIREILDRLPPKSAQIVELRIGGFETAEIARRVDSSLRTVERVLQDFRRRLSRLLNMEEST